MFEENSVLICVVKSNFHILIDVCGFIPGKYFTELRFGLFPTDTDINSMSFHSLLPQPYGILPPFFFSKNCMQ